MLTIVVLTFFASTPPFPKFSWGLSPRSSVPAEFLNPARKSFLPVGIDKSVVIPIVAAKSLPAERVEAILGFNTKEVPFGTLAVKLNGWDASGVTEELKTEQYCGAKRWDWARSLKVYRWNFLLEAFRTGVNHITFVPVEGSKTRILWSELALDAPVK